MKMSILKHDQMNVAKHLNNTWQKDGYDNFGALPPRHLAFKP